ncbi:MAG: DUF296 domain-containing protein [Candidatus Latescibacteria bacterium]|nr:DUF296 domain-containing protein [Candidatus Latescibacterota bacterium]NIM22289.1 DUF296 domain-containing protein [Candidatus Latescibacterota bacterium]NIM65768.1 DUF296 domain-containing protein [Candidatus Latescibacterota bacterium]NIO02153.1 DUF296 domain-containing protein [Candidatus Latescibacterota bacterium]NIO28985.1 DUF296 domain-containing protein [Candidatus Latescibacterota bacterium]
MKYAKFGDNHVLRLERGEEVVETITAFVREKAVKAGSVSGIGAVADVTLGFYDPETKEYHKEIFMGSYEIANICGSVSTLGGEEMLHIHATIADRNHQVSAGHLFSATVSVTLEVLITQFPGVIERKMDEAIGLNLMDLD